MEFYPVDDASRRAAADRKRRTRRLLAVLAALAATVTAVLGVRALRTRVPANAPYAPPKAPAPPPDARAPTGVRIKVEVLNATSTRGLARRAMLHLRDRGFDVLDMRNAPQRLDSTLVLDRSGHPDWARLVAAAMGGARVESSPDTSRYLDLTVLVGASWRPPAQPFYP